MQYNLISPVNPKCDLCTNNVLDMLFFVLIPTIDNHAQLQKKSRKKELIVEIAILLKQGDISPCLNKKSLTRRFACVEWFCFLPKKDLRLSLV